MTVLVMSQRVLDNDVFDKQSCTKTLLQLFIFPGKFLEEQFLWYVFQKI